MSQQYGAPIKTCATCQYWGGSREVKQYGDYIEVNSPMNTAPCYNNDSSWRNGPHTQACGGCPCWEKWGPLRWDFNL